MERARLQTARLRKHWTLKEAAAHLETDANTLNRWELGKSKPRTYSVRLLCTVYGASAYDLGLSAEPAPLDLPPVASTSLRQIVAHDLTICLFALPMVASCSPSGILLLQGQVKLVVEEFDMNTDKQPSYQMTRREALRQLALIPIQILSLRTALSPPEEILRQCAAGITACEYLSNGVDLPLASQIVATYLPALTAIVQDSSAHRVAAAHLVTQGLFLQTILGTHLEGMQQAVQYAQQAITYSRVTGDAALQITAHGRLAWVYSCQKQKKPALEQALKARSLLHDRLHPSVRSYSYGVLAKYQALTGQKEEATTSLRRAHEAFFTADQAGNSPSYMDHDLSNFLLDDGTTYLYMSKPEEALRSFAQLINPDDLHARVPMAERIRVEVLNSQTTASLKLPKKDMDQTLHFWEAAMSGAKTLKSEQRFAEACASFEIMECIWSGERRIEALREQMQHW